MTAPTDGTDHTEYSDHPDLTGVAGAMRAEWRAEQEAATADAAAQWRHGRGLPDWLCERMHAGDRIAVTVAEQSFVGLLEEVGDDLLALRCAFGRVEIHVCAGIPISFELVEHATQGGTRAASRRGFRDALLARDAQAGVRVGTLQQPDGIDGTLLVSRDFVTIATATGGETVVPLAHVAWVTPVRTSKGKSVWGVTKTREGGGGGVRLFALSRERTGEGRFRRGLRGRRNRGLSAGARNGGRELRRAHDRRRRLRRLAVLPTRRLGGEKRYTEVDIVPEVVSSNRAAFARDTVDFVAADIRTERLPSADLLVCKDVLQHWDVPSVQRFLARNGGRYRYALITNDLASVHIAPEMLNADIPIGHWRTLDLERPPFGLAAQWRFDFDIRGEWTKRSLLFVRARNRLRARRRRTSALRRCRDLRG